MPKLYAGLERTFLDAVDLTGRSGSAAIHLVSSLVLPMTVEAVHAKHTKYTVFSYPDEPRNKYHEVRLLQSVGFGAVRVEQDGEDAFAWGVDDPEILKQDVLVQPSIDRLLRHWCLGAYVLDGTVGYEFALSAWQEDDTWPDMRTRAQQLIDQEKYLAQLNQQMLDEFCV